jgi:integrase
MSKRGNDEGSIYQRKSDQRWVASVTTGRTPKGKPQRLVAYGATKREASRKLAAMQQARAAGLSADGTRISVARHLETWLTSTVARRVRPSTLYSYRNYAHWYLVPHIGRIMLARLRKEDVQAALNRLSDAGRTPRTVARARTILAMALADAAERGLVSRNVAALTSAPRVERFEHVTLTPSQARALLATATGTPYETLLHLALLLGLRRGEIQALRWRDIDLQRDELRVARTLTKAPGAARYGEPKTRAGRRTIPLSPMLSDLLTQQWQRVVELRRAADRGLAG